ncbi:MAG: molecular chaperone TorD family protein, partial [Rhodoplanes sp.]
DHIALFSANFPLVPCPPYGSLFLVDENKRLEEMLAIKNFYQTCGVETASSFDDLPDHICVELEFMQLLCFREHDANVDRDSLAVTKTRRSQAEFLDRFLLPFVKRLAELAARTMPDNPYTPLLDAAQLLTALHRSELSEHAPMSLPRESLS